MARRAPCIRARFLNAFCCDAIVRAWCAFDATQIDLRKIERALWAMSFPERMELVRRIGWLNLYVPLAAGRLTHTAHSRCLCCDPTNCPCHVLVQVGSHQP